MTESRKNINRFDSFTPCRSVVIGQINWTLIDLIEDPVKREYTQFNLEDLNQTFDHLLDICKQFDIHVDRPTAIPYNPQKKYVHPYFEMAAIKNPITPSDTFLCLADTIVEVASVQENAYFDHMQYKEIWNEYFDNGSKWIAAPVPTHNPEQWDGFDYYDWAEILFDAPCVEPVGNTVLLPDGVVLNNRARVWLERQFPQFEYFTIEGTRGHLDSYFRILKPGLIYSAVPKEHFPAKFQNWDFIYTTKTQYTAPEIVSELLQDDDFENTVLDVNGFSIDEENFIMMEHVWKHHPDNVKQIESHGINCIPLPFETSRWFNQGINCIMNATNRTGTLVNYF